MSNDVYAATILRIKRYCAQNTVRRISIVFHGGEPTLVGVATLRRWCELAITELSPSTETHFAIQTNGTLIDTHWADLFKEYRIDVGISLDGPKAVNDIARMDMKGRSSYPKVMKGIRHLQERDVPFGILTVLQFGADPLAIHREFVELGSHQIGYLLPHHTHDTIQEVHARYGQTPCADYLIPIMDHWAAYELDRVRIREFWSMGRLIMGGDSLVDSLGNNRYGFIFVESDGEIEGLDILRTCDGGEYSTGLTVQLNDFADISTVPGASADLLTGTVPLPEACVGCREAKTCAGGYFPHRYSRDRGFNNQSVWCEDLKKLFEHMRDLLGVTLSETETRRERLRSSVPA